MLVEVVGIRLAEAAATAAAAPLILSRCGRAARRRLAPSRRLLLREQSGQRERRDRAHVYTFSHCRLFADLSTASVTLSVASASRNVGARGLPCAAAVTKSANWCVNVCS